ncbi:MAG: alpha/beta hydrolase-fold protein [Terrimesophilobacter sp.]
MRIDSDAVMWSAPERERAGRPLLVLLHAFGSHEGDMFAYARSLPLEPVIASVRAPLQVDTGYNTWFPSDDASVEERLDSIAGATGALLDWIDTTASTGVGLLGLSQGGAMALQLLRERPDGFDYVVQLSGFVLPAEHPGDARLAERQPPVFWGRGTVDDVIPASLINHTQDWLAQHATLTEGIYEGLGHEVSQRELSELSAFIRSQF